MAVYTINSFRNGIDYYRKETQRKFEFIETIVKKRNEKITMEKAGMYVRLFFKENTTGSVRCGRGERKDTDGIKAEGVYGNGNGNFFSIR